jgi:hypothetical protein
VHTTIAHMDGPVSPRSRGSVPDILTSPRSEGKPKSKKKMKDTIKVMFKTEKKKKDKSKQNITRNVKLLREFLEEHCMYSLSHFAFLLT